MAKASLETPEKEMQKLLFYQKEFCGLVCREDAVSDRMCNICCGGVCDFNSS